MQDGDGWILRVVRIGILQRMRDRKIPERIRHKQSGHPVLRLVHVVVEFASADITDRDHAYQCNRSH